MKTLRHIGIIAIAALVTTLALDQAAHAQDYPTKPIRLVVPVAPGGLTDILTRLIGQRLQERLGQPVVVDNKPGAGGIVAMSFAAKAAPDGYTLIMGYLGALAVNQHIYKSLPYDPLKDFEPISLVAGFPVLLITHPSVPARNIREFIQLAKSKQGQMSYASGGNTTVSHLAMELFQRDAGIQMVHIPYKGAAPAMTDLIAGQVTVAFDTMTLVLPQVKAGKIRALAVASKERSSLAPEIPTIAESGIKGFEVTGWYGILAPARTPQSIVSKLSRELMAIVNEPAMREKLAERGIEPIGKDNVYFSSFIREEADKWQRVVRDSNIKVD